MPRKYRRKPRDKKIKPKSLSNPIKQSAVVRIETTAPQENFKDVDLYIEFLDGTLKGMKYRIAIDYETYEHVWG